MECMYCLRQMDVDNQSTNQQTNQRQQNKLTKNPQTNTNTQIDKQLNNSYLIFLTCVSFANEPKEDILYKEESDLLDFHPSVPVLTDQPPTSTHTTEEGPGDVAAPSITPESADYIDALLAGYPPKSFQPLNIDASQAEPVQPLDELHPPKIPVNAELLEDMDTLLAEDPPYPAVSEPLEDIGTLLAEYPPNPVVPEPLPVGTEPLGDIDVLLTEYPTKPAQPVDNIDNLKLPKTAEPLDDFDTFLADCPPKPVIAETMDAIDMLLAESQEKNGESDPDLDDLLADLGSQYNSAIDDLLADLNAPAPPPPAQQNDFSDLDELLAGLGDTLVKPTTPKNDVQDDELGDIDSLLDEITGPGDGSDVMYSGIAYDVGKQTFAWQPEKGKEAEECARAIGRFLAVVKCIRRGGRRTKMVISPLI